MTDDIEYGRKVVRLEAEAVAALEAHLDERFQRAVDIVLDCAGQVIATGMGKSGIIAQKISATLASSGTPSFFLHPAEAAHGDLGRVGADDVVLALSNSGESEELRKLIPGVKRIGARLIAITRDPDSPLAQHADCVLTVGAAPEACPVGLAPTTSTTAQLALGDALAMTVAKRRNFTREDYALYHPGGALGRELLKVAELMHDKKAAPPARIGATARDALLEAGGRGRRPGALPVVGPKGKLRGLLTDGDVRRHVLTDPGFIDRPIEEVMTRDPMSIRADQLAAEAWRVMNERKFNQLPVVDADGRYLGLLDVQDFSPGRIHGGPVNIRGLVLDVDGVLTDGTFYLPVEGDEYKAFHASDGLGLRLLMDAGVKVAFLSGRKSGVVDRRARELGVHKVVQGRREKTDSLRALADEFGCALDEMGFVGDDLVDIAPMRAVAFAAAPADARPEVREIAHFVAASRGGRGAVRDICEHLLQAMGAWDAVRARFGL